MTVWEAGGLASLAGGVDTVLWRTDLWSDCCAVLIALLLSPTCATSDVTSAPAERLVRILHRQGLDVIAARDPLVPGRVVAARRFGRTQVTLVAVLDAAPQVDAWLAARRHDLVYRSLLTQPVRLAGFVLHDLNGLGLRAGREPGQAFDMFDSGDMPPTAFDGDWGMQGLSREEYCVAFTRAEQAYARALELLLTALQRAPTPR
jgi:hypothetical protein